MTVCRSSLLVLTLCRFAICDAAEDTYFPPPDSRGGWRTLASADERREVAGLDTAALEAAWEYTQSLSKNSSLLVVRHGWLCWETYKGAATRDSNRDMHSCGKAFTCVAVGILMNERPDLFPEGFEQFVYTPTYLPAEAFPLTDPRKANIKLGQMLSMTSGIRGNNPGEGLQGKVQLDPPGPDGSFPDQVAFGFADWKGTSARTMWTEPGSGFSYASANPLILGAMIRKLTRKEVADYLGEKVFGPLGWEKWRWASNPPEPGGAHHTKAQGGIAPRPRDAARFGYLCLHQGQWGDRQLVPRAHMEAVRKPSPYNPYHSTYGMLFTNNAKCRAFPHAPSDTFGPSGAANNHIWIIPSLDMVVVRIGDREKTKQPFSDVHREIIERVVAAVTDGQHSVGSCAPGAEDSLAPYPRSDLLTGVEWDWSTFDKRAPGSDIWPITWADDGNQYAAWGDGGGFGGDNRRGRVPLGVARISGDWRSPHFENVWGGDNPESPAMFGGKSFGIISVDSVLFMWWSGDQSDLSLTKWGDNTIYSEQRIAVSTDHGRSWKLLDWKFTREQLVGCATFVNCGQDNSAAPDRYVYSFLPRLQRVDQVWFSREGTTRTSEIIKPGRADLARVPADKIHDRKAYEFFAGIRGDTQPMWTQDPAQRKPVFQDPRGVRTVSCTYNPGLDRYLLANMHTKVGKVPGSGNLSIFESRNPWGPWRTVVDQRKWGSQESGGPGEVIGNLTFFFAPKWISEDGAEFTLIFTDNDHYGSVRGRFVTSER